MDSLNPPQREAVLTVDRPLLVVAGAGSGKTRVITMKIAHLIREHGYQARNIAAITFTNKAAREMCDRATSQLRPEEAKGLNVSTFHTLGLNIIRRELKTLGYKSTFSIFDGQDAGTLLKELARKDAIGEDEEARWAISRWKNDFVSPQQALSHAADEQEATHARLYEAYQRQLKAYNAVDFDDLIVLPVQLLSEHPDIRDQWQNRLRYLLLDEYQDTNTCQYQLVKLLAGPQPRFTAVGDDDQSIYAWRGARPENLDLLQEDYPGLRVIKLEQNYRSTERILTSANRVIANNPHKIDKKLWSSLGEGELLRVLPCANADAEADRIVSEIMSHKFRKQTDYADYAILYRGNHQSRLFERKLREHNIPYKVSGGTSFFERAEVKDILGYLRLVANTDDDAAFLRIVNTPRREIGAGTLEKLGSYASERHISLFDASFEMGLTERLSHQALTRLLRFSDWIRELNRRADHEPAEALVREIIGDIHYADWLYEISSSDKVAEARMENVNEVAGWIGRIAAKHAAKQRLGDVISHMMLMDILERNNEEKLPPAVLSVTLTEPSSTIRKC
ncbi:unnamed protein product [Cyprideis torosa]|uniref:DNA 3'-5' helicase n=1 Tax=Cyprideis torosa TaxID=163714 RepID=A0A7R8ZY48_9CRUS|nr:unnamed protein product [Cyprideis torosa]CAG0908060.1 unnamed protein product [Cyprideis torosa]